MGDNTGRPKAGKTKLVTQRMMGTGDAQEIAIFETRKSPISETRVADVLMDLSYVSAPGILLGGVLGGAVLFALDAAHKLVTEWLLLLPALFVVVGVLGIIISIADSLEDQAVKRELLRFEVHDDRSGTAALRRLTQDELRVVASWPPRAAQLFCDRAPQQGSFVIKVAIASAALHEAADVEKTLCDLSRTGSTLTVDGTSAVQVIADALPVPTSPRVTAMIDRLHPVLRRDLEPFADAALADLKTLTDRASRSDLVDEDTWAEIRAHGDQIARQLRDVHFHLAACDQWADAVDEGQRSREEAATRRDDDAVAVLENFVDQRFPRNPLDLSADRQARGEGESS